MEHKKVMIFIRPQEHPASSPMDADVRIEYGNKWITFKNGQVFIDEEPTRPTGGGKSWN